VISYAVLAAIYWLYPLIVGGGPETGGVTGSRSRDGATAIFCRPVTFLAVEAPEITSSSTTKDRVTWCVAACNLGGAG